MSDASAGGRTDEAGRPPSVESDDGSGSESTASQVTDAVSSGAVRVLSRLKGLARDRMVEAGLLQFAAVLIGAWLVLFLVPSAVVGAIIEPVLGSGVVSAINLLLFVGVTAGVGWSGYRGRQEAVRRLNYEEMAENPDYDDVPQALEGIGSDDPVVQEHSANVLYGAAENQGGRALVVNSEYSSEEVVERIAPALESPVVEVRQPVAQAFRQLAHEYPEVVSPHAEMLAGLTRDGDPATRGGAIVALGQLARPVGVPELAEDVLETLRGCVDDDVAEVRLDLVRAIANLRTDAARKLVGTMATDDPHPEVREVAQEELQALRAGATDDSGREEGRGEAGGDAGSGQRAAESRFVTPPPETDFEDVIGMDAEKAELREQVIGPFTEPEVYDEYGVGAQTGVLLHGPPGTGKTYLAECLAGELGLTYLEADVGDIDSKWVGEGAGNVSQLFEEARANQPALVFLDELDALASERGGDSQHHESQKIVNQLLQEISRLEADDRVLVVGATNHPDDVDEAMLRTGRFDAKIEVTPPDADARVEMLDYHLTAPSEPFDDEAVAEATRGLVASDVREIAQRAARRAAARKREGRNETVTQADVVEAAADVSTSQSRTGQFIEAAPDVDFGDVAGMEGLKETLREKVIDPLENPEYYEEYGLDVARGFLLYGPPGTGKTHVARCLAGELGINYISADAGQLVSKYIGEGAENVKAMFEEARANQPCLVFVDEIDALASDRAGGDQHKSERQMVNQFLEELSAINDGGDDVIVIAATNLPGSVDDAMLRTGRLGERIEVPAPDADARVGVFYAHLDAPHQELDDAAIAERTEGLVASDIEAVATEAAMRAMRRARDGADETSVTDADVTAAIEQVRGSERAYDG